MLANNLGAYNSEQSRTPEDCFFQKLSAQMSQASKPEEMHKELKRAQRKILCRGTYFARVISLLYFRRVIPASDLFALFEQFYNVKTRFARAYIVEMMSAIGLHLDNKIREDNYLLRYLPLLNKIFDELDVISTTPDVPCKIKRNAKVKSQKC